LVEECLTVRRTLGSPQHLGSALLNLAALLRDLSEHESARHVIREAIDLYSLHRDRRTMALALASLGSIATAEGDYPTADRYWRSSLTIEQELGELAGIAYVLERYAVLAAACADSARAVRLVGAAAAFRDSVGVPLTPAGRAQIERALEPARRSLGPQASDDAWNTGRALSLGEAIATALAPFGSTDSRGRGEANPPKPALTQREREIAVLIARGQTNRQIAAELVITEGTVANHVVHILAKLGYNARSQIAVWAANNRLLAT
jgi:DNA-binding CsgD family transcriptional regulator